MFVPAYLQSSLVAYYTYTFKATNHAILDTAYCAYYIPSNMVVIM